MQVKKCRRCGYIPKRKFKKDTGCPRCHYKPPSLLERIGRAIEAFKAEPSDYRPRKIASCYTENSLADPRD